MTSAITPPVAHNLRCAPGNVPAFAASEPRPRDDLTSYMTPVVPQRRSGPAEDIASAVFVLASISNSRVTDADLLVAAQMAHL